MSTEIIKTSTISSSPEMNSEENHHSIESNEKTSSSRTTSISGAGFLIVNGEIESIPVKCYDRLIEELKCPGCATPMRSPIRLCEQGHSICDNCTKRLENCPLCKKNFTMTRSLTLEALSVKAQFCCSYATAGCKVRLPLDLLEWHEKQCKLKIIKCFMGRVWNDCDWMGREEMWPDHLASKHMNKVYITNDMPIEMTWNLNERLLSLAGFYVYNWQNEIFNLYQIFDKQNSRVLWSMTIAGKLIKKRDKNFTFAYEIEIYCCNDESKFICQRYPCHMEQDKDILQEGTCVSIPMSDISRFIVELDKDKFINYRVKIHKVKIPEKRLSITEKNIPIDFKQTSIEGGNHKSVSPEIIVTRKLSNSEISPTMIATPTSSNISMSPIKENKNDTNESPMNEKNDITNDQLKSSDSESDPELEAFVNDMMIKKKWTKNVTTPNLTRKFWDDNYQYNDSNSSLNIILDEENVKFLHSTASNEHLDPNNHVIRLKKKNSIKSFRETFKNFRTELSEKNYFGNNSKKLNERK